MNKKGIIAVGPAVIFVNLFLLVVAAVNVVLTLGLVSGIVFNKKIKTIGWRVLVPRIIVFILLTLFIIIGAHFVFGPTYNHYIAMLWGALAFFVFVCLLSLKNIKENSKEAFTAISVMTLLFILISQITVYVVINWF
jgi:hypothetical protein